MKIYLIRHGNAIDAGSADHEEDSQRVLTEMGCEKMKNIAAALKTLGVKPDLIVSSPYARSIQTTQILK